MWCPKCKTEYVEGVEICADCKTPLVPELTEDDFIEAQAEELEKAKEKVIDELTGSDAEESEEIAKLKEELSKLSPEELNELVEKNRPSAKYVKAEDKYKDNVSTAVAFIVIGVLGLIFIVLNYLDLFSVISGYFSYLIYTLLCLVFIFIGISSYKHGKAIQETIAGEKADEDQALRWLEENATDEVKASFNDPECSDEENALNQYNGLIVLLREHFPDYSSSFVDYIVSKYMGDEE